MNTELQTWGAAVIVVVTAGIFVFKGIRAHRRQRRAGGGCGSACGCGNSMPLPPKKG